MADSLKGGAYLAGGSFSNADCAVIPYILRLELLKLGGMWEELRPSPTGGHGCASALGQSHDLRSHGGQGLGALQESRTRPLAQGTGIAESGGVAGSSAGRSNG